MGITGQQSSALWFGSQGSVYGKVNIGLRCPCRSVVAQRKRICKKISIGAVLKLSGAIPLLADSVGNHTDFQQTKRHGEILRADILELKQKIARHQEEHGC
jgi:hypothetical protein